MRMIQKLLRALGAESNEETVRARHEPEKRALRPPPREKSDPRIRRPYTPEEERKMDSVRSHRYRGDDDEYHHGGRPDEGPIDTISRLGTIAPPMGNPSLDPASGDPVMVSYLCGYGRDTEFGHDAMDGVDRMVTDTEVDANDELRVSSATEGGPLQLAPEEDMDTRLSPGRHLGYEEPGFGDWTTHL